MKIQSFQDIWQIGLAAFGLHLVVLGLLSWRSTYVPRWLAVLLVVAGAGYLADSFGTVLSADRAGGIATVTFVGEPLFLVWLLVRGRGLRASA